MPNWCATQFLVSGSGEDVRRLCDDLNGMDDLGKTDFSRWWLGNLWLRLGYTEEQMRGLHARGSFNPDVYAGTCLAGPEDDNGGVFAVREDGCSMCFSTHTAWSMSDDLLDLLLRHYPSLTIRFSTTDEFGNFHYVYDPDGLGDAVLTRYVCDGFEYSRSGFGEFVDELRSRVPDWRFPDDVTPEWVAGHEDELCEAGGDGDDSCLYVAVYVELGSLFG